MERDLMAELMAWKSKVRRKPLILNGARQVGKTWLLREFGRTQFEKTAYVSLDNNTAARNLFEGDFDTARIISGLSVLSGIAIEPGNTLIILDEIQAAPKAITALKYFCENAPEYAVAAAGSLLGLSAHEGSGFPVGKVQTLDLYPLSFQEYLSATGNGALRTLLESRDTQAITDFAPKAVPLLRQYYVIGGMPGVVDDFLDGNDYEAARQTQVQILEDYTRDFVKHASVRLYPRMMEVWESIPAHLSHENKRFIFGHVRQGARAKDFEEALTWLAQAGLITKVPRVSKPGVPLSAYVDGSAFKVFLLDVGLLGAMSGLDVASVMNGNAVFEEFKGALTEQYVCQQLVSACGLRPYYWSADNSSGEIDFLVQRSSKIVAVEVKAEENLRAKSLRAFTLKHPQVAALRFSLSGYREQDWMRNIPLYACSNMQLWG
ncbi:ATP-binding protein [Pseudoscardovia suis]|uniref:ATP-binding protein n=1 Tax=Pseudoscardovia suis TaxID=987063 RepID=UPI003F9E7F42